MLSIRDAGGNDLQETPPAEVTLNTSTKVATVGVYCTITEDDASLPVGAVGAVLDWNDGTQPVEFDDTESPLTINGSRALSLGTYAIRVTGHNNRAPNQDTVETTFIVNVAPFKGLEQPVTHFFGPILPKDNAAPNAQTWMFDTGSDLEILASSVKMLLITTKGERVMQPSYGTNLRRILFELNIASIETIVHQEITKALVQFEPRVRVRNLDVARDPNNRSVTVQAALLSNFSSQPFEVSLQFNQ